MLKRIPIRLKLVLLAGVPVIGALILAAIIALDARHQAQSAVALGSIEDLARLSARMAELVHTLQFERNELSLRKALKTPETPSLKQRFLATDAARKQLSDFLAVREVSSLPPRLARDLTTAEERLRGLERQREQALSEDQPLEELLAYYRKADLSLISATAALSQLSNDGELMRAISALVIVLQIKERASQEHALLSHVFSVNEFPAGTYKDLVTLTTEEADYIDMLNVQATDLVRQRYRSIASGPEFARTAQLRKVALDTLSDDFQTAPEEWSSVQGEKIERLRGLEVALNDAVRVAALAKIATATRAVRLSYGLGGGIIALSALLAGLIARGISRSVASLARAAEQIGKQKNFQIRALKTSNDELGNLADTFNDMLSGIQARDAELRHHGENLELLVDQRTAALQQRNQALRLVLDNVEQGLATIELDGRIASERSRAFDDWFGDNDAAVPFAERLAGGDTLLRDTLQTGWEQVTDGFLPLEVSIDQLPRHIAVGARRYDLSYKAIVEEDVLRGALLVVSDVTREAERMRRDAEQRELIAVFDRFMRDRAGFSEFFKEAEALVGEISRADRDQPRLLRTLHTLKGNCAIFGVESVAKVAHELETSLVEAGSLPTVEAFAGLAQAWQAFALRVRLLSGGAEAEPILEVNPEELHELEAATRARAPHARLVALISRLTLERGVVRLRRVAEQARSLAQRMGKGQLDVEIEVSPDVRFQPERWAAFWSSFVHVVRNALDHGIESPEARVAAGKPVRAKLTLRAEADAERLRIEISDDGRGIDWPRVAAKAKERGLPYQSQRDLSDALFCDGLSTAASVSELSGRGVGMSAVRDAARSLRGVVFVISAPSTGTTVRFDFPIGETSQSPDASSALEARSPLS